MGCFSTIDFAPATGAHLSFYWTMNEGGTASKADSTQGLLWPLIFSASAAPGLFSNGTDMPGPVVINQNPGLLIPSTATIQIIQANSKGVSIWWWTKKNTTAFSPQFDLDTSDPLHTNRIIITAGPFDGTPNSGLYIDHTNDTNDVFVQSPNINLPTGTFIMVAGTYDKVAQTLNVYTNGVLTATIADPFVYPDLTNATLSLVNRSPGTDGVVDELGLCLNGALTQSQITALYNGGVGVTYPGVTAIVPFP